MSTLSSNDRRGVRQFILSAVLVLTSVCYCPLVARVQPANNWAAQFRDPPDDCGMTVYWAWHGPAVTRAGIDRDLRNMRAAHISGATILPLYPLSIGDKSKEIQNQPFLGPEFSQMLAYASSRARELGLSLDVTLGTGWPYGGPWITPELAARRICLQAPRPLRQGEELVGQVGEQIVVSAPTNMHVKRPALGGEGLVLDPFNPAALDVHLKTAGAMLSKAVAGSGVRAYWCDSLEVYDANWTSDFPDAFRRMRGYELVPHLSSLFGSASAPDRQVRYDYWLTVSQLAAERFYRPLQAWCHAHGAALKAEPYGQPPVSLGAFAYVDRPTGEHYEWRMLNATRWAAAGGHLHGHNVIDAEAWTWVGLPNRFADSLEQLKLASDMHFVSGANALMAVSYVYAPPGADPAYWLPYWGPAFNDRQPWWRYFPLLARYVQRVSWLLRQGKPVANVALYLPEGDVFAEASADRGLNLYFGVRERLHGKPIPEFGLDNALAGDTPVISTLIKGGYSFDCIDTATLAGATITDGRLRRGLGDFSVVVMPNIEGMPLADLEKLAQFVRAGGTLVATRRLPDIAYGLRNNAEDSRKLQQFIQDMFRQARYGKGCAVLVPDEHDAYLAAIRKHLAPDLPIGKADPDVAFVHRRLADQDLYFIANLSDKEKALPVLFGDDMRVELWNPLTGTVGDWDNQLHLEPFGSAVLRVGAGASSTKPERPREKLQVVASPGPWKLQLPGRPEENLDRLRYWTEREDCRHFSGMGTYTTSWELSLPAGTRRVLLDLGEVHEVAEVLINGQPAGVAWRRPYRLDVTRYLRSGVNRLEVRVTNLLINEVLGKTRPDYSAIHARFGQRFPDPEEWSRFRPHASGLAGPVNVTIVTEAR